MKRLVKNKEQNSAILSSRLCRPHSAGAKGAGRCSPQVFSMSVNSHQCHLFFCSNIATVNNPPFTMPPFHFIYKLVYTVSEILSQTITNTKYRQHVQINLWYWKSLDKFECAQWSWWIGLHAGCRYVKLQSDHLKSIWSAKMSRLKNWPHFCGLQFHTLEQNECCTLQNTRNITTYA